jgi:hypothetical protein
MQHAHCLDACKPNLSMRLNVGTSVQAVRCKGPKAGSEVPAGVVYSGLIEHYPL